MTPAFSSLNRVSFDVISQLCYRCSPFLYLFFFENLFCDDKDHECDNNEIYQFSQEGPPQLITIGPRSTVAVLQAPPGIKGVIIGMMTLSTNDFIRAVYAIPIIKAIAKRNYLIFIKKVFKFTCKPHYSSQLFGISKLLI